jgi:hypothetical protein
MFTLTPNRLSKAIETVQGQIDERLDEAGAKALGDTLAVTFEEHFQYQQLQARAHVMGNLTTDEAQIVYVALGEVGSPENGGWAAETTLATKVVVTQLMGELLEKRLA